MPMKTRAPTISRAAALADKCQQAIIAATAGIAGQTQQSALAAITAAAHPNPMPIQAPYDAMKKIHVVTKIAAHESMRPML